MEVKQIYEIINSITSEDLGLSAVLSEDPQDRLRGRSDAYPEKTS